MKQATNPFAPVPLWRKRLPGYAAMGAATVAMAVGLIAMQHARTTVAGTLLPVSEADAAAYGISAVTSSTTAAIAWRALRRASRAMCRLP